MKYTHDLNYIIKRIDNLYLTIEKFINIITRIKNMICKCIHVLLQIVI